MKIVDVIRKLEVLGDPNRNPNEAEARAARKKAAELREKHGLVDARPEHPHWQYEIDPNWFGDLGAAANRVGLSLKDMERAFAKLKKTMIMETPEEAAQLRNLKHLYRGRRKERQEKYEQEQNKRFRERMIAASRRAAKIAGIKDYEKEKEDE